MTVLSPDKIIVNEGGESTQRMAVWLAQVSDLSMKSGAGSPEGVVKGVFKAQYMDTTASTGSILYIKRDASIGGDATQGWILV